VFWSFAESLHWRNFGMSRDIDRLFTDMPQTAKAAIVDRYVLQLSCKRLHRAAGALTRARERNVSF
jgi:hypothetical protein